MVIDAIEGIRTVRIPIPIGGQGGSENSAMVAVATVIEGIAIEGIVGDKAVLEGGLRPEVKYCGGQQA